jgi:hypothetical protein
MRVASCAAEWRMARVKANRSILKISPKQDFGKVEAGFPMKILREQKTLGRLGLADQRKPA